MPGNKNRKTYAKARVVLTRRGKKPAAIVPLEDLEMLERLEERLDLEKARTALAEPGQDVSWTEFKKQLGL